MKTLINGKSYEFNPLSDETAIELIRDKAGLTGTKLVCGQGVCGACTVLVDGTPTVSCVCPAHHLEGRKVQTVEAHGVDKLHPIQKAFMACDGLQCGFCTPGFINEGVAFYDRWRSAHGTTIPPQKAIADAMGGHLCRCGAYIGIYEAISRACAGEFDGVEPVDSPRVEAVYKVTGAAKYTADIQLEGQLAGSILRSPYAHAKILSLDSAEALAMEGVKAVTELLPKDHIVRYAGQEIAAVAAVDKRTADQALKKIRVKYDIRPVVVGLENALAKDAPLVWADGQKDPPNAAEGPIVPGRWKGNMRRPMLNLVSIFPGRARRLIQKAKSGGSNLIEEGRWQTSAQIHTTLEPHCCVAHWQSENSLIVYHSTQSCSQMAREIAHHFHLSEQQVEVRCEYVGGAFGSKLGLTNEGIAAIKLSKAAKAPVSVVLSRAEEMIHGGYRPPAAIDLAMVATPDQKLKAISAKAYTDSGIGINSMVATLIRLIYPGAAKELVDFDVVTNLAPGKPFRGPSAPLTQWALEQAVDGLAHQLGADPIALRKKWDTNKLRQKLYDWAAELPVWKNRQKNGSPTGRFRKGVGVAMGNWFYFYHSETQIEIKASEEGIQAFSATQDMGNGTRTVIARAIAEVLGITPLEVQVQIGNSQEVRGPMSGGSRTTPSVYVAAKKAAKGIKAILLTAATNHFDLSKPRWDGSSIQHATGKLALEEVLREIEPVSAIGKRGTDSAVDLFALLPMAADDLDMGAGFTGAVCLSEVEVDMLLGKIKVLRVWGGLAIGKVVVPELALSQCQGAVIQGIGYALYEERIVDEQTGQVLTTGLEDYRIPGIGDMPEINIHFLEENFKKAKEGVAGLAEIAKIPIAACIGNAVFNATGWQPKQLPIRPDMVLEHTSDPIRQVFPKKMHSNL